MAKFIPYTVEENCDHIIDERGNQFIAFRKLAWGEEPNMDNAKWDVRKWYNNADGEETVGKGVSFLTEDGPHNFAKVLVEQNFGHTIEILNAMKDRSDFRGSLNKILSHDDELYDESFDSEIYIPGDDIFLPE